MYHNWCLYTCHGEGDEDTYTYTSHCNLPVFVNFGMRRFEQGDKKTICCVGPTPFVNDLCVGPTPFILNNR